MPLIEKQRKLVLILLKVTNTMNTIFYAQASNSNASAFGPFIPLIVIFFIFYFLLIRPQNKKQKQLEAKKNALKKGDTFITSGGIYGKVKSFKDNNQVIVAEIANGININILKAYVVDVIDTNIEKSKTTTTNNKKIVATKTNKDTTTAKSKETKKT